MPTHETTSSEKIPGVNITISREHHDFEKDISACFDDKFITEANLMRFSDAPLHMQVMIGLATWIGSNVAWDIIKIGLKKFYEKFPKAHVTITYKGIMYAIGIDGSVKPVIYNQSEYAHIRTTDDLIKHIESTSELINEEQSKWRETSLGEVAEIIMGQSPRGESYNFEGNGLPFYQGVTEFQEKYVGIKSYTTEPTKIVEEGTILFSVRAPVGRVNFVQHRACIGRGNAGITMRNGEQEFLFYLLVHIEKSIKNRSSGTVFDSISGKELKEIPILLPSLPEQRAIADILSSLDAKIELLRKQNETLEKTAQTIFHEWFGRYSVESPEELPEGWRVGKLGEVDFISFGDGNYSAKYPKQSDFIDEGIPFISNKDISNGMILSNDLRYISHEQHSVLKKGHLKQGDILISTRANIGDIALVSSEFEDANINAQLVFIRTDNPEIYSNFLYIIFSSKKYRSIFESYSSGSAQAQLPMHALRQIQIITPTQQKFMEFSGIINPLFHKLQSNNTQIQSLSKTRDTLLPKLMSGEVKITLK